MSENQKPAIRPNECSLGRWILVLVLAALAATFLSLPIVVLEQAHPDYLADTPVGFMAGHLSLLFPFIPQFLCTLLFVYLIAKTPVRAFLFGKGESIGVKTGFLILGLYLLGLLLSLLPTVSGLRFSGISTNQFLIHFGVMLLLVWIQTTTEEFMFRGIFIRYACGNNICMSRKAIVMGLISSALFMVAHFANPEILEQDILQVVAAALSYFVTGFGMYMANLYFKSLMPGILIHWLNNMTAFVFVSNEVSVGQPISLFVDTAASNGALVLVATLLAYVPLFVYIAIDAHRKKKAAA